MTLLHVTYYSNALSRKVSFNAIVPSVGATSNSSDRIQYKTLYLLHGIMGDCSDWLVNTRVAMLAEEHNLAVIMPSGENRFYVDHEKGGNYYGEFIGKELVEETRRLLPLSDKREDTFIAGLSMGGYGALRNGLKYSDTFSAIAGLSSALIIDDAIHSIHHPEGRFTKEEYEAFLGNLEELKGSDKDIEALVRRVKQEDNPMPKLYLACGTEDFLLKHNRKFRDFLISEKLEHIYIESAGGHEWNFWDEYIGKVMQWLIKGSLV